MTYVTLEFGITSWYASSERPSEYHANQIQADSAERHLGLRLVTPIDDTHTTLEYVPSRRRQSKRNTLLTRQHRGYSRPGHRVTANLGV